MSPKWKHAVAANAVALSLLVAVPARAVPTCTKVGERHCGNGCYLGGGGVNVDGYTCVEVESSLVPELTDLFTTEYENPPGWTELCDAVLAACSEWAAEGGGGN